MCGVCSDLPVVWETNLRLIVYFFEEKEALNESTAPICFCSIAGRHNPYR